MQDFAKRIPDLLESVTKRIRAVTVEPLARVIKFITLGLVATILVVIAIVFLLVGLFRIIEDLLGRLFETNSMEIAYAIVGGVFLLLGALLWSVRTRRKPAEDKNT